MILAWLRRGFTNAWHGSTMDPPIMLGLLHRPLMVQGMAPPPTGSLALQGVVPPWIRYKGCVAPPRVH
jgi:hypothetical protein